MNLKLRLRPRLRSTLTAAALALLTWASACEQAECANPDYTRAECRALAAWELAEARSLSEVELRFVRPDDEVPERRHEGGHLREPVANTMVARVAAGGDFAIAAQSEAGGQVQVDLRNVSPYARVFAGPIDATVELLEDAPLERSVQLDLQAGETHWIRGQLECPTRARIAFLGDIQTNPDQFERIVERLRKDANDSADAGTPLLALSIAGDLTENSLASQFDRVDLALARSPVPVQLTPGNHDIYKRTDAAYNLRYGPGTHETSLCGLKLVHLDTGSAQLARSVEGRLPALLSHESDERLILVMHYPPYAGLTGAGWSREDQAQHLLVEAAIAEASLIVAGHYHGVVDFDFPVGPTRLREIIVGTGGANQGLGTPRYGYLRVEWNTDGSGDLETCFVEVPPPGATGNNPAPSGKLPLCED